MKLIKFLGGESKVPMWIDRDSVVMVMTDIEDDRLVCIDTLDGKSQRVFDTLDNVINRLNEN